MQHTEAEESLRRENEILKRQIAEMNGPAHDVPATAVWRPSTLTISAILFGVAILVAVAFFAGYLPMQARTAVIAAEAHEEQTALPKVEVTTVGRSSQQSGLQLPGTIQPITEAPILARADGYIAKRFVDIGDVVKAGQPLAEIDAPELTDQVKQSEAMVQQAQAALEQAIANVEQGKADTDLAKVTADRSGQLVGKGAISKQDNDQSQAQYRSKLATLHALEKSVEVQRSNIAAAQSNLARLQKMQGYRVVQAPFEGVVTQRNVDVGALVNAGNTLLFRIGQTGTLRTYVNVPQAYADSIRAGQTASLLFSNLPGRQFTGEVVRTSNALDPSSRTLLTEIHVRNVGNLLMPGMYAQVQLQTVRTNPPLLIPSDAMIVRSDGSQVAVVDGDGVVHLRKIQPGRDYGDRLEVLAGLRDGESVVLNPADVAREGTRVHPLPANAAQR